MGFLYTGSCTSPSTASNIGRAHIKEGIGLVAVFGEKYDYTGHCEKAIHELRVCRFTIHNNFVAEVNLINKEGPGPTSRSSSWKLVELVDRYQNHTNCTGQDSKKRTRYLVCKWG